MNAELRKSIRTTAADLGIDPLDLATVMSYETAGTFDPWQKGPTTKHGQHRGLIQWGEPQRKKYGVTKDTPVSEQVKAAGRYLQDAGVKSGMGLLDIYSAINAGAVGRYNASDEAAGGAPGTVRNKVETQMSGHRKKAEALMASERKKVTDPAVLAKLNRKKVTDPAVLAKLNGAGKPAADPAEQRAPNSEFGTLTGTEPSALERVGNALFDAGKAIGLPVDRMRRDNQRLDAGVRGAADVATFGLSDEIAAGAGALTGIDGQQGNYSGNLDYQRARDEYDAEVNPEARFAGQLAGGVALGRFVPASAPNAWGRIKQGATLGAAAGGAYGFGSGEGVEDRFVDAGKGAIAGGLIGAAIPAATSTVRAGYNTMMDYTVRPAANAIRSTINPTQNAMQLTQRALARDGLTPQQAAARMQEAVDAGDDSMMLIDVGGDNTRRLGRFATNIPGEGANTIKDKVFERQLAQPDRVISAIRKGMKDPEEYYQTIDDLVASREAYSAPMYKEALSKKIEWNDRLGQFVADPAFKRGLAQGIKIQRLESLAKGEKFDPMDYAIAGFDEAGEPILKGVPNMRTLNVIKKGLDVEIGGMKNPVTGKLTEEGRALDMVRREFLKEVDAANPAYAEARSVFASHLDAQFAVDKGRDLLKADAQSAKRAFAGMTDAEKEFARVGVSKAIIDDISKAKDGMDVVRKIFGSPKQRAVLEAVFPSDEGMNEFRKSMFREGQKTRTKNAVTGNSTTAQQTADLLDNQIDMGVMGNLFAGRPVAAITAAVQKSLARATVVNDATAKHIADVLTTNDPKVAQQVVESMEKLALKDKRVAKNLLAVRSFLRNSGISIGAQQSTEALAR